MKKIIMGILCGILVFFPIICIAAYVIHLEDGRSFTTSEYREEGDQIKFKRFGGVIGIPKDQVKEIEVIEDLPEEKTAVKPEKPSATEKAEVSEDAAKAAEEGKQEATEKDEKGKEEKDYENQKRALMRKYLAARKTLAESVMNNDKIASEIARSEMNETSKKLSELNRKVRAEKGKETGGKKAEAGDIEQYKKEKSDLLDNYLKTREKLKKANATQENNMKKEVLEKEMSEILKKLSEVERKIKKEECPKK